MRQLLQFDAVIAEVEEELLPNRLCSYLFELSQVFNRFYDQVPVLKADGPARRSRLGLLGIPSLEWMGGGGGLGRFRLPLFARQLEISHPILALWLRNRQLHQAAQALRSQ